MPRHGREARFRYSCRLRSLKPAVIKYGHVSVGTCDMTTNVSTDHHLHDLWQHDAAHFEERRIGLIARLRCWVHYCGAAASTAQDRSATPAARLLDLRNDHALDASGLVRQIVTL